MLPGSALLLVRSNEEALGSFDLRKETGISVHVSLVLSPLALTPLAVGHDSFRLSPSYSQSQINRPCKCCLDLESKSAPNVPGNR